MIQKSIKIAMTLVCLYTLPSLSSAKPSAAVTKLVPNGWKILSLSEGDLNQDHRADVAMIIEKIKTDKIIKDDNGKILHNNPRKLLIFINHQSDYQLTTENKTIPVAQTENSCLEDPLAESNGIEINKGLLTIEFSYFMACGGWEWPRHTYTFRYQKQKMQLIGFDYNSFHRSSGEKSASSYNFSTLRVKRSNGGNQFEDGQAKNTWNSFKFNKPLLLEDINFDDFYTQFE